MGKPNETIFGRKAQKKWMEYAKELEAELWVEKNNDFNYWRGWVDGFDAEENIAPAFFKEVDEEPKKANKDPFEGEWNMSYPEETKVEVIINSEHISKKYLNTVGIVKEISMDMHSFGRGSLFSHKVVFDFLEPQYFSYKQLELAE